MRRLIASIAVALSVLALASCGGAPPLTKVQQSAVNALESNLGQYQIGHFSQPVVEGQIAKNHTDGSQVTFVYVSADQDGQGLDLLFIVVEKNGKLVFADVLLPSGSVTVTP